MKRKAATRSIIAVLAVLLLFSFLVPLAALQCGAGNLAINSVKLEASDLGEGWTLQGEVDVNTGDAAAGSAVEKLFDLGAEAIVDQGFVKDAVRLQVNYVQMKSPEGAEKAVDLLRSVAGANRVGARGNIAVVIIGSGEGLEKTAEALKI